MMVKEKNFSERRQHTRFTAKPGAYAALTPYSSKRGQLIDISENGLSFSYMAGKKPTNRELMAILIGGIGVFMKDIQFITVYDTPLKKNSFFAVIPMRRCGGRFENLNAEQAAKLEYFIMNYTTLA